METTAHLLGAGAPRSEASGQSQRRRFKKFVAVACGSLIASMVAVGRAWKFPSSWPLAHRAGVVFQQPLVNTIGMVPVHAGQRLQLVAIQELLQANGATGLVTFDGVHRQHRYVIHCCHLSVRRNAHS